jgi:hypothetical protein
MNINKMYNYLRIFIVAIFSFVIIRSFIILQSRTVRNDIIQGILLGFGLGFVMLPIIGKIYGKRINGWITIFGFGKPGKSFLFRAACAQIFPGPINLPQEAMYWRTNSDGAGHTLKGNRNYIIHFPKGQLPPNNAFWSLTMGDAQNHFVPNPINRYSVSNHSGLMPNADGSVDIYIQNTAPKDHKSNWLPAPIDNFILWLRVYEPGASILNGTYQVPPVMEVKS